MGTLNVAERRVFEDAIKVLDSQVCPSAVDNHALSCILDFEESARLDADWSDLGVNSSGQVFPIAVEDGHVRLWPWPTLRLACKVCVQDNSACVYPLHRAVPNVERCALESLESWSAALPVGVLVDPRARHVCMSITDDARLRIAKSRNVEGPQPSAVDLDCALMRLISAMWDSDEETWRRTEPDAIGPPVTILV